MKSQLTLQIEDLDLREKYLEQKNQEIIKSSRSILYILMVLQLFITVNLIQTKQFEYMPYLIIPRIMGLTLHYYLIKIAQYYPARQTCEYHGPMIVILQLTSLLWITKYTPQTFPMHLMVSSFTGIFITMTYGLICSASWYLTTSAIIMTSLVAL